MSTVTVLGWGSDFRADFLRAPYRRYRELREQGPLFRTSAGMWLATGSAPCAALLRDPRFGHGEGPPGARTGRALSSPRHGPARPHPSARPW